MARKDINIRVRAEDKASREAKRIADALKLIAQDGKKASDGASKFGSALGAMSGDMAKLEGRLSGLKAFDKLIADMNRAEAVASRLDASLAGSGRGFATLRQQADQAAQATAQYRQQLAEQERRQQTANADVKTAASLQRDNKRELEAAQRALKKYNDELYTRGRGANRVAVSTVPTADQMTRGDALKGTLAAAESQKRQLENTVRSLRQTATESGRALAELATKANAAANEEKQLAGDVQKAGNALLSMRVDAQKNAQTLENIRTAAAGASANLGGVAAKSEDVARAAQKSAAQLAQLQARVTALQAPGPSVVARTDSGDNRLEQIRNLKELNKEYIATQAEVRRLASEMRSATEPTVALGTAYGTAQTRVSQLKTALDQQRAAIRGASQEAQSGYAAWARAFNPIVGSADRAAAAQKRNADQANRTALSAMQIAPAVQRAGAAYRQKAGDIDRSTSAMQRNVNASRNALSLYQRMRSEIIALTASYVGLNAVLQQGREAVSAYQTLEAVQSRLGAVLKQDVTAVGQEMDWLRGQANRLGIDFRVLGDEYAKFAIAADAANFTMAETREIFLSVAEAGRVNKLSMDQMSGIFLALQQMISKGKVTSEELRRQLGDRLPGAFNIFAKAIGVSTAELDKMMRSGEVLADRSTLLAFAREMTNRFGPQLGASLDTLTTDMGKFDNSLFRMRIALAQGFVPALREALQAFNDFAASSKGAQTFATLGNIAGRLIQLFGLLTQNLDLLGYAAAAFVGVKLGGYLTSLANPLGLLARRFNSTREAIDLIGPSMARIALQQTALGRAFSMTILRLDAYQAQLTASAAASGRARGATMAFAGALGAIRTAMVATASVARAMWAAIGGLPGLIATGIVVAISHWVTRTEDATTALVEHERQMSAIREAYQLAGKDVDNFAKSIENLTLAEAERSVETLTKGLRSSIGSLLDKAQGIRDLYNNLNNPIFGDGIRENNSAGFIAGTTQLGELLDRLEKGEVTVSDFRDDLDKLYRTTDNDDIRNAAAELLTFTTNAEDGGQSMVDMAKYVAEAEARVRVILRTATEADMVLLGLAQATDEVNESFDRNAAIETYTKAIDELKSKIPALADEMERLKNITELNATAWGGLVAAWNAADYDKMLEIVSLWAGGIGAIGAKQMNDMLDGYGAGDSDVINRIIYVEGGQNGGGPDSSSARGIGQFIDSTWLRYLDRLFPELQSLNETQKLALRTSEEHATKILTAFTRDNQATLLRNGLSATPANTYLAHFLGAGDAVKVLLANPEELAANIVNPASVKANPSVFPAGLTVRDLRGWAAGKMGDGSAITGTGQTETEKKSADEAKATAQRIADLDHQIAQQEMINSGKEREAAIEDAIRTAKAENANISAAELARIREQTGALYDQQNARKGLELSEEKVNQLYTLRQQLLEQMKMAEESGDATQAAGLKIRIEEINGQLTTAIANVIAMWQAVGGPEAEAAIAKLQTMGMSLENNSNKAIMFGLNMSQVSGLVGGFVDGLVGALDNFAKAVASGEDAFGALKNAFLQFAADFLRQIAMMILKQMLLNLLAGFGGPIGTAAAGLGGIAGHTGGMVGSGSIGSGNRIGMPAWVGAAYHTGGVAGLRPDEVSATLRVGEEILTEQDPRHRNNMGGEKSSDSGSKLTQVLAIGEDQVREMINRYGKDTIVTTIKSEAPTIRRMLGI